MSHNATANNPSPTTATWIAYEKSGAVAYGQLAAAAEKNVRLSDGDKVPHHRVWITDMPEPQPAFFADVRRCVQALDITAIWRAAGRPITLVELAAAVAAADRDTSPTVWQAAVLQHLLADPAYFRRTAGLLTPVPPDTMQKIAVARQKQQVQQAQEKVLLDELADGAVPSVIRDESRQLMFQPDKNTIAYRALKKHVGGDGAEFINFFIGCGILKDVHHYWRELFIREWPPLPDSDAVEFSAAQRAALTAPPKSAVQAFSIDDADTVEVDDAFSVQEQSDGSRKIGVHIAAPALVVGADDPVGDAAARRRLISVYFPDGKHTMLPTAYINALSLSTAAHRPVISLYIHHHPDRGDYRIGDTVVEQIRLHGQYASAQMLDGGLDADIAVAYRRLQEVCALITPAAQLPSSEEHAVARANFKITATPPRVVPRPRDEVAVVVETLMRFVNSVWAKRLTAARIGGLFRRDGSIRTRPPSDAEPYMWLSSPLRRYIDLSNQRLLVALLTDAPPPKEVWHELARQFNQQHERARHYQQLMERHWALCALAAAPPRQPLRGDPAGKRRVRLLDYPLSGLLAAADVDRKQQGEMTVYVDGIDLVQQRLYLTK